MREEELTELERVVRERSPDRPWDGVYPHELGAKEWHIIEGGELTRLVSELRRLQERTVT